MNFSSLTIASLVFIISLIQSIQAQHPFSWFPRECDADVDCQRIYVPKTTEWKGQVEPEEERNYENWVCRGAHLRDSAMRGSCLPPVQEKLVAVKRFIIRPLRMSDY
ncbi:unnamed protein product, partial [Mesorhabditis spiculigera]